MSNFSLVSRIVRLIEAAPYLGVVKEELKKRVNGDNAPAVNQKDIAEIIDNAHQLDLPRHHKDSTDIARTVFNLLQAENLTKSGAYVDIDCAKDRIKEFNERGMEQNRQLAELFLNDFFPKALPILMRNQQNQLRLGKDVYGPILDELFSGDYKRFKKTLQPLFGGDIPHENLIKKVFESLNKEENQVKLQELKDKLNKLFEFEISSTEKVAGEEISFGLGDSDALQYQEYLHEIFTEAPELFTYEEKLEIARIFSEIPEKEILAIIDAAKVEKSFYPENKVPFHIGLAASFTPQEVESLLNNDSLDHAEEKMIELAPQKIIDATANDSNVQAFLAKYGYRLVKFEIGDISKN